jgi:drug/metabolite transporter (DMT)-like permease
MSKMIFAFIAANVVVYLAFAFIVWDFDPAQWSPDGRFVFVYLGVFCGGAAALSVKDMK